LASYRAGEGIRIKVSASTELDGDHFDVAVRSGVGEWPGWRSMANLPLMGTPMLTPALAAGLSKPADLLGLRLLPDERWPSWFKAARVDQSGARFAHVEYPTQELAAAAAVDGAGVALLSPALFGSLTEKGRLVQPFEQVVEGPGAYHVLVRADEVRDQVLCFCNWLANSIKRPQPSATTKPASQVR
jgi:LysR family glycine cleavage system transcriptional activator